MKWIRSLLWMLSAIFITSCNDVSREEREIRELHGRKIEFCRNYESISLKDSLSIETELLCGVKIVTYIDESSCSECVMRSLLLWKRKISELTHRVGFIPVVFPADKNEIYTTLKNLRITSPLMYDTDNVFIKRNKLTVLARNRTFLLDRNNRIVLVGEPILNKSLWELYKRTIQTMITNDGVLPR